MDIQQLLLTDQHLQDLNPLIAGEHMCPPRHRYGPYIRHYTLMHYVLSGKGTFYAKGNAYPVRAGQVFLILPGEVTTYEADPLDPWHYCWVGFTGSLASRFRQLPPVFSLEKELFVSIFPESSDTPMPEYHLAAGLLRLYGQLFPTPANANRHVRRVQSYIQANYMQDIHVATLAKELNLDRRYLTRLFKEQTKLSVQQYLIRTRMHAAKQCLEQGYSVQEAAALCGYRDVSNFSRMYKQHFGHSPGWQR